MKTLDNFSWRKLFALSIFSLSLCSFSQELCKDTVLLQEVEISSTIKSKATSVQTISRQMIEAIPSSSVADALKYMAGVQIKDYGGLGGQKTVNVRSLGSQHVSVFIDGVRVTNAQNGTVDLGKYSLSTLETVSLYNANKSEPLMMASEYASASTIYLQTHRPEKTEVNVSGTVASFGTYKGEATVSLSPNSNKRNVGAIINAAYVSSRGNYPFSYHTQYEDTTGTRRNSDIKALRIENSIFWQDFQLHTYYYDSERGLPGGIVRRLTDLYTDVGREWDRNFFSQLSYRHKFDLHEKGEVGVRGILKYANDHLHYRSDYEENISVHANNRYHQQDAYAAFSSSWNVGQKGVSFSSDFRWSDLVTDVKNFHYVYRLDSKTSLSAFYSFKGINLNVNGLYTQITDYSEGESKPLKKITWDILLSAPLPLPEKGLTFRAFYKEVFRAPTLNDLYYTMVGNRNLRPEYTRQLDIGFTYSQSFANEGHIAVQADGYYNRVEDRIVCLPLKGAYQWTMLNYGHTRCLGADISADIRYHCHNVLLTATIQDDRNRTEHGSDSYNDFVAYSPRSSFSAVYSFKHKNLTASLSHMYVGERYWTAENAVEAPLKAYNCTDLRIGYSFSRLEILAECQDVFDQRYELIQRWPMPGRQFSLTIRYKTN